MVIKLEVSTDYETFPYVLLVKFNEKSESKGREGVHVVKLTGKKSVGQEV